MEGPIRLPSRNRVASGMELNWTLKERGLAGSTFFEDRSSSFGAGAGGGTASFAPVLPLRDSLTVSLPAWGAGNTIGAVATGGGPSRGRGGAAAGRLRIRMTRPAPMMTAAARPAPIQTPFPGAAAAGAAAAGATSAGAASVPLGSPVVWEG